MSHRYLLVDFENVPKVDLAALPDDVTVPFFFGASQKSVSKDFLKTALKLGPRFVPVDIGGREKMRSISTSRSTLASTWRNSRMPTA